MNLNAELGKLVAYQMSGKPDQMKPENLSLRLTSEHTEILHKLSEESGKSRGAIAKLLLEAALFQMGHERGILPPWMEHEYQKIVNNTK